LQSKYSSLIHDISLFTPPIKKPSNRSKIDYKDEKDIELVDENNESLNKSSLFFSSPNKIRLPNGFYSFSTSFSSFNTPKRQSNNFSKRDNTPTSSSSLIKGNGKMHGILHTILNNLSTPSVNYRSNNNNDINENNINEENKKNLKKTKKKKIGEKENVEI
jgi:hypothetical protein